MELKLKRKSVTLTIVQLLIVPYGIETPSPAVTSRHPPWLLIVPYGIETVHRDTLKMPCAAF